jgi:hypothetical protein
MPSISRKPSGSAYKSRRVKHRKKDEHDSNHRTTQPTCGVVRTHVFPGEIVGAYNDLHRWLHLAVPLDDAAVRRILVNNGFQPLFTRILDGWHPDGGPIYFHLLPDRLAEVGFLQGGSAADANKWQ